MTEARPSLQAEADAMAARIRRALKTVAAPGLSLTFTAHLRGDSVLVKDLTVRPKDEEFKPR